MKIAPLMNNAPNETMGTQVARNRAALFCVLGLFLVGPSGCALTQPTAGESIGSQTGDENTEECVIASTSTLERTEEGPGGFSAATILAVAQGPRHAELTWMEEDDRFVVGPEEGTVRVEIEVDTSTQSAARWVDYEPNPDLILNIQPVCRDRLEVDTTLTISTERGALDERLSAVLFAFDAEAVDVEASSTLDGVSGELVVMGLSAQSRASLEFRTGFWQDTVTGALRLRVTEETAESASFREVSLATW